MNRSVTLGTGRNQVRVVVGPAAGLRNDMVSVELEVAIRAAATPAITARVVVALRIESTH